DESAEILPLPGELLDLQQDASRVTVDDRITEPEERLLLDRADQLQDRLCRDLARRRRRKLVERRDGVAERAVRAACDQRQRCVLGLDALAVADATEKLDQLGKTWTLEDERLAAGAHGWKDLGELGRAEDEHQMRRRLLDQLQQRIPRRIGE